MSIDEQHIALPSLYGAPATRRPSALPIRIRPFDPDELPIEAQQTDEEREFTSSLPARAYAPGGVALVVGREPVAENAESTTGSTTARSSGLRAIAGRLLRS